MNEKIKKAFSHKLNVFGKAVPTFLVAMLLIGGGTAATLTAFVSITSDATVNNQAISTSSSTSFTHSASSPPEVFVDQVELTNNNDKAYETVKHNPVVTDGDSTSGQSVTIIDVEGSHTVTTNAGVNLEISYDEAEDEVMFTPVGVSNYGSNSGVVFGLDTDNDGKYDFQVDTVASGAQGDLYEYDDQSTGKSDFVDHNDYTSDSSEYNGVFYTDPNTELSNKDSFTLTVDAQRLGSTFGVNAEKDGSSFLSKLDASNADEESPGQDVTGSTDLIDGSETRTYAVFTELSSDAQATTYNTAVSFNAVAQ